MHEVHKSTGQTVKYFLVDNDFLSRCPLHHNPQKNFWHVMDTDRDGNTFVFRGTKPLETHYRQPSFEEIKAWACDELGLNPDKCTLEMDIETLTVTTMALC